MRAQTPKVGPAPLVLGALITLCGALHAPDARADDEIWLRNGDRVTGRIERLADGKLQLKPSWGEAVTLRWSEVVGLRMDRPLTLVLDDETRVTATLGRDATRTAIVRSDHLTDRMQLDHITAINPPRVPPIRFRGLLQLGVTVTDGNTQTTDLNAQGRVTARADRMRLLLRGVWNYGESRSGEETGIIRRNTLGEIQMDFFVSRRLFLFTGVTVLGDVFRNIKLRFVGSAGAGYQWLDTETITLSTDLGIAYLYEDRRRGEDEDYVSLKVGWKLEWILIEDRLTFFNNTEFLPRISGEEDDLLITMQSGTRISLTAAFFAALQVDLRYDQNPSEGFRSYDVSYIGSFGYSF